MRQERSSARTWKAATRAGSTRVAHSRWISARGDRQSSRMATGAEEPLDVLGEDVHLEVHRRAARRGAERRALERLGDQGHGEVIAVDRGDGQRDAVDRDRPLLDDVAQEVRVGFDRDDAGEALLAHVADRPETVDVALDDVAAEAV